MHLVWFRNDLRVDDNPALHHACNQNRSVKAVYCDTPDQWAEHDEASCKIGFRCRALNQLQKSLADLGIALDIIRASRFADVPGKLVIYCLSNSVEAVHFNEEYPLDEKRRDEAVHRELNRLNIKTYSFNADLLLGEPLVNQQGNHYRMFTPWYKAWLAILSGNEPRPIDMPQAAQQPVNITASPNIALTGAGEFREDIFPADEAEAHRRLQSFLDEGLSCYPDYRDLPAINGTSTLSPYLSSGLISIRRCFSEARQADLTHGRDWRENPWIRELGWREFYRYLIITHPRLSQRKSFRPEMDDIRWEQDNKLVEAWQHGQTGFPIIDAGMRQLKQTGWMHNRIRMLTASFFCKLMLHDWKTGEQWFMQNLIDGDYASNNGGWQWSASTGCDSSPWFRVFNPYRQSEKFDPRGAYIRKFIPEIAQLSDEQLHSPIHNCKDYPEPIIDYETTRKRVLERFKSLNSG